MLPRLLCALDPTVIADHLAERSNDYRFLFTLAIFGFFVWIVLKYMVQQIRISNQERDKERQFYADSLKSVIHEAMEQHDKVIQALNHNSAIMENCTRVMADMIKHRRQQL